MDDLLIRCNENLKSILCCHSDGRECNCYECLKEGYWAEPDTYNCEKKMNYYVLNYGPSYASEIYHYLSNSKILEGFGFKKDLRILSLGCGFAPDLIAILRYIDDEQLPVKFKYCGIDQSVCWTTARYLSKTATFIKDDVATSLNFNEYDLVFIVKLFSTLYKHNIHETFLKTFHNAVKTHLRNDSIVVFNDINSFHMGRDLFHASVKNLFSKHRQFYCDDPNYKGPGWTKIPENKIVFSVPPGLSVLSLMEIRKTIFFEYRK